jgi:hypothetical protein
MEPLVAKNFNDYVTVMAANSPHALVMDGWRRLDLSLRDYARAVGPVVDRRNRNPIEQTVSLDQALGPKLAGVIRQLRQLRNRVAHRSIYVSPEEAAAYARRTFSLIAVLARRVSELEGPR